MENIQKFIYATSQHFKRVSQISNQFEKEALISKRVQLKKEYTVWILSLKQRMHNKQFRKVISDIEINYQKYKKDNSKQRYNILFWFNQVFLILEQLVLTFRPELNKDINIEEESTLDKIELD